MIVRIGFAPRFPGMDIKTFFRLWDEHAQLASKVPLRLGYVQDFAVLGDGRHLLPYPGFDVCAETIYESASAMDEAFSTVESESSITDHDKFVNNDGYCHVISHRSVKVGGRPTESAVKLMTFMRKHPNNQREQLPATLDAQYSNVVAQIKPMRHEQLIVVPSAAKVVFDAVDIIWFAKPEDALAYVSSETAHRASLTIACHMIGSERLIARPKTRVEPPDLGY